MLPCGNVYGLTSSVSVLGRQDLQGDVTLQPLIVREIDLTHAARTQLGGDPIMRNGLANQSSAAPELGKS